MAASEGGHFEEIHNLRFLRSLSFYIFCLLELCYVESLLLVMLSIGAFELS